MAKGVMEVLVTYNIMDRLVENKKEFRGEIMKKDRDEE